MLDQQDAGPITMQLHFQGSMEDYNETVKCAKDAWKSWAMV